MNPLIQARIKAFSVQAGVGIALVVGVFLSSPDFKALVTQHFGTSFVASSAYLFLVGLVSHITNKLALKKLGTRADNTIILI